jgi:hypothetical protein
MPKKFFRFYSAAHYHKNERDLDRRSDAGWRLAKPGLVRYAFEPCAEKYRYRLDYYPDLPGEQETTARRELYEELGWRKVGETMTGWSFWEKPYDPSLPADEYDLPPQRRSDQEKLLGPISVLFWLRIAMIAVGLVFAVVAMIRRHSMVVPALIFFVGVAVLFFEMREMQEKMKP